LTVKEIKDLAKQLGMDPQDFIRKKEQIFIDLGLGSKDLNLGQWCKAIVENPKLLERPILSNGKKAAIGRPLENFLEILK